MTKLVPDEKCTFCNGVLVPPSLAPTFKPIATADYVCMNCGRAYRWVGNPPKLTMLVIADPMSTDEMEDDDAP